MKKRSVNKTYINSNMDLTFSLRRQEIVEAEPQVSEVRERWPALFTEEQDTDPEESYTKGVKVGIITVVEDDVASSNSLPTVC
ncbi:hypothetical protein AOXY_G7513 [Acipenser oxyrinchus oxyrinchus]|uniref:Uncharacterized protein n=1 Tax=Acipenser oxyrinchus oxyrinchus TaxID=40147 RepID=A0AAD8GA71_ACIOX|nr:hypothetical protein AOXY_G7513 [Acipenser oxyrinchus oxyrinchus]